MTQQLFFLRVEYNEYKIECRERGQRPLSFRDWQEVTYYYEELDSLEY